MKTWRCTVSWMPSAALALATVLQPVAAAAQQAPLVDAVKQANQPAIDAAMRAHTNVNASQIDGTTALHWAANNGDLATTNRLIAAGANVRVVNRYGISPIWLAAQNGHGRVVEALLRAGADPNTTRGESGETVVMIAARSGQVDVLQRLIAHGADVNRKENVRGQSALIWAAGEGHADAARVLAAAGADLAIRSSSEMTPLMFAIRSGHIDTVRELLDQGADIKATGADGTTMLSLALINANWEIARFLVARGADPNGNDPVNGRPLQALAFMRRAENRGLSPVLPRRQSGAISSIQLAEALLAAGARVNDRIDWKSPNHVPPHMSLPFFFTISYVGATPFFLAAMHADIELMKFLLANGADPTIPTAQKVTPLLAAAGVGHSLAESPESTDEALQAVQLIYALGADLKAVSDSGCSPATAAGVPGGGRGRPASPKDGCSALHGAVIRESPELVRWLIDHEVPLDQTNKIGQTALDSIYTVGVNTSMQTRTLLGVMLRDAMIAKGLPVPPPPSAKASF